MIFLIDRVIMPKLSALMKKGRIEQVYVNEGQCVKKGDVLFSVSAEKATTDIEASNDGYVAIKCELYKEYEVGAELALIGSSIEELKVLRDDGQTKVITSNEKSISREEANTNNNKAIRALPIAKRLAKENNIDLSLIEGTGHNGLITREDVEKFINNKDESVEVIELDSIKKSMFEHMELTKDYVKGTTFMDVDMHLVKQARANKKHSYTSYIAHAVAKSLVKFPLINSSFQEGKILIKKHINIGVALDNADKLFVPVIKNADKMGISEIEKSINTFKEKAKNNKIDFDDLSNGTFTITNSGIFGSLCFSPIINYPQSAIMGIGKIADRAVVYNNAIYIRPIMIMSLSYDHRIIEGSVAVKFLAAVKEFLENPLNYDL